MVWLRLVGIYDFVQNSSTISQDQVGWLLQLEIHFNLCKPSDTVKLEVGHYILHENGLDSW